MLARNYHFVPSTEPSIPIIITHQLSGSRFSLLCTVTAALFWLAVLVETCISVVRVMARVSCSMKLPCALSCRIMSSSEPSSLRSEASVPPKPESWRGSFITSPMPGKLLTAMRWDSNFCLWTGGSSGPLMRTTAFFFTSRSSGRSAGIDVVIVCCMNCQF